MSSPFDDFLIKYSREQKLTEEAKKIICANLSLVQLKKRDVLIREQQRHDFVYFIIKGAVRSYYLKEGVEVNTWFAFEHEMVGSLHNYRGEPSKETFELVEHSTLISIDLRHFKHLVRFNLEISNFVRSIIEEYAIFLEDRIFNSQFSSAIEKYEHMIKHEPEVLKRIPLTYIATYLGISRETLSRLRAR